MFKLIHKNRKGFSLVELLVVVAVLGIGLALVGNLLFQMTNFNNMATYRYEIQNAVKMAYTKFETKSDTIIKAYQADVLYDSVIAAGILVTNADPNNFQYEWIGDGKNTAPLVLPSDVDEDFTYIFSTPAKYKETDQNIGYMLFIRENGANRNELYLNPEGMGTVPVEIQFAIATNAPEATSRHENDYKEEENPKKYIGHSVKIAIKSGKNDVTNYCVDTSYTLENIMQNNKSINYYNGELVREDHWGNDGKTGPAGWINGNVIDGFPTDEQKKFTYIDNNGSTQTGTLDTITKSGNIMRFISPESYFADEATSANASVSKASCLTSFVINGSEMADRVLDNLRLFRDNVLRGTEFGDWFIHQYYYVWSPFLIEHTAFLKPVYQAILIPVSYVCEFIAKL